MNAYKKHAEGSFMWKHCVTKHGGEEKKFQMKRAPIFLISLFLSLKLFNEDRKNFTFEKSIHFEIMIYALNILF